MPYLLICVFVCNIFLLSEPIFKIIFLAQVIFYLVAIIGLFTNIFSKLTNVPKMFVVMNSAAVVGLYRFLFNRQDVAWQKTR